MVWHTSCELEPLLDRWHHCVQNKWGDARRRGQSHLRYQPVCLWYHYTWQTYASHSDTRTHSGTHIHTHRYQRDCTEPVARRNACGLEYWNRICGLFGRKRSNHLRNTLRQTECTGSWPSFGILSSFGPFYDLSPRLIVFPRAKHRTFCGDPIPLASLQQPFSGGR